jgi:arylsulfatase A-like enzyme
MVRRQVFEIAGIALACVTLNETVLGEGTAKKDDRPNILFIMTDQQSAHMMSCAGDRWLKTPALDELAATGIRFERAYATNPVCVPSRFSLQTGRMPSAIGMRSNANPPVPDSMARESLGVLFSNASYETVYGGKVHLPGQLNGLPGYRSLTADSREGLAEACVRFIKQEHDRPFLLFASFINPHDICYMAINDALRAAGRAPFGNLDSRTCERVAAEVRQQTLQRLTPLPPNHGIAEQEPEAITAKYLQAGFKGVRYRKHARDVWQEEEWRVFRDTYRRLTEMVDEEIGQVLKALKEAGLEENTLIVFTSDHGDMDGTHKLQHKSVLYEEAARVPFMMSFKGKVKAGVVDDKHLISNGLDLLPTLCDYARIEAPTGLAGKSLRPIAEGRPTTDWRDYLVVESAHGRMLRTDRFKYCVYDSGKNREQLIDLANDPGEMTNLAGNEQYEEILDRHRQLIRDWVKRTGDTIGSEYLPEG